MGRIISEREDSRLGRNGVVVAVVRLDPVPCNPDGAGVAPAVREDPGRVLRDENGNRTEFDRLHLAGKTGADTIRKAVERDNRPAKTTLRRGRTDLRIADAVESESERLGRPVSVAEILGIDMSEATAA